MRGSNFPYFSKPENPTIITRTRQKPEGINPNPRSSTRTRLLLHEPITSFNSLLFCTFDQLDFFNINQRLLAYNKNHNYIFQGEELNYSLEDGIIISNQSLVLQKVTRKEGGFYQCHATNQEGQGSSQTVKLPIKCKYFFLQTISQ